MWLIISMYTFFLILSNLDSNIDKQNINFFYVEFLHRAADLTLVPSAAIAGDLLAARVTAGEHKTPLSSLFSYS